MDPTLTILPARWRAITRAAACAQRKVPVRLTRSTCSHSASGISRNAFACPIPALFTRMSRRPNSATTAAIRESTCAGSLISIWKEAAAPPSCRISSATRSAAAPSTSTTASDAPSRERRRAISRPMPRPAPVTRAILLLSVMNSSRPGWGRPGACPTGSELDTERHLHDAPATGRRDLTEAAAGQVARGVRELSVIQRVERVPPEVHGPLFQESETLVEGEGEVLLTRSDQSVAAHIAELTREIRRKHRGVEVLVQHIGFGPPGGERGRAQDVRTVHGDAQQRVVAAGRNRERHPALEGRNAGELPPAECLGEPVRLLLQEREFPNPGGHQAIPDVVIPQTPVAFAAVWILGDPVAHRVRGADLVDGFLMGIGDQDRVSFRKPLVDLYLQGMIDRVRIAVKSPDAREIRGVDAARILVLERRLAWDEHRIILHLAGKHVPAQAADITGLHQASLHLLLDCEVKRLNVRHYRMAHKTAFDVNRQHELIVLIVHRFPVGHAEVLLRIADRSDIAGLDVGGEWRSILIRFLPDHGIVSNSVTAADAGFSGAENIPCEPDARTGVDGVTLQREIRIVVEQVSRGGLREGHRLMPRHQRACHFADSAPRVEDIPPQPQVDGEPRAQA